MDRKGREKEGKRGKKREREGKKGMGGGIATHHSLNQIHEGVYLQTSRLHIEMAEGEEKRGEERDGEGGGGIDCNKSDQLLGNA